MYFKTLLQQEQQKHTSSKKFDFEHDPYIWFINLKNPIVYAKRRIRSASKAYQCHVCKQRAREKMCFVCSNCHLPICKSCHQGSVPTIENMTNCVVCHQKYYNLQRSTLFCSLVTQKYRQLDDFLNLVGVTWQDAENDVDVVKKEHDDDDDNDDYQNFIKYLDWYCDSKNKTRTICHVWNLHFSNMKCWLITNFLQVYITLTFLSQTYSLLNYNICLFYMCCVKRSWKLFTSNFFLNNDAMKPI